MKFRHSIAIAALSGLTAVSCDTTKSASKDNGQTDPYYAGGQYPYSGNSDYVNVTPAGQSGYNTGNTAGGYNTGGQGGYVNTGYPGGTTGSSPGYGTVAQGAGYAQGQNPAAQGGGGAPAPGNSGYYQPPATPPPSSQYAASGGRTYTVAKGDTLYRISREHGTSVDALISANGLSGTLIRPGEVLSIP